VIQTRPSGTPIAALDDRGGSCKPGVAGDSQPLLEQTFPNRFEWYNERRLDLWNSPEIASNACKQFIPEAVIPDAEFGQLRDAVNRLVAYDGNRTTKSRYETGVYPLSYTENFIRRLRAKITLRAPLCGEFLVGAKKGIVIAMGQGAPTPQEPGPPKNIFINSASTDNATSLLITQNLTEATILHEVLHNLTGKGDLQLAQDLNLSPADLADLEATGNSSVITSALVTNGCALR
jgi:hypothetical protein